MVVQIVKLLVQLGGGTFLLQCFAVPRTLSSLLLHNL